VTRDDLGAMRSIIDRRPPSRVVVRLQRGSFLLEALMSVLIVAFGILGLIGLQARAFQNIDDAQYRAEAAYLANQLIGQMWVSNQKTLVADFDSSGTGAGYTEFQTWVRQRLPGAANAGNDPVVTITPSAAGTANSSDILVQIFWQPPGEPSRHRLDVTATIGTN
jgi:type IV pilus assembly protein PilV